MRAIEQPAARPTLAPWPYFGGKSRIASAIWERFGDVQRYVEPFCGSAAVLLSSPKPAPYEVIGDADGFVVNALRAIRCHPEAVLEHFDAPANDFDCLARGRWLCEEWAVSSAERLRKDPYYSDPKAAAWWVYIVSSTIDSGRNLTKHYDWSTGDMTPIPATRLMAGLCRGSRRGLEALSNRGVAAAHLQVLASRLRHVCIYCGDWKNAFRPEELNRAVMGLMLDPPYALTQRVASIYAQEWSDTLRTSLLELCRTYGDHPNARIALCGLDGEYDLPGWEVLAWTGKPGFRRGTVDGRSTDDRRRLERIWFSPHCRKGAPTCGGD